MISFCEVCFIHLGKRLNLWHAIQFQYRQHSYFLILRRSYDLVMIHGRMGQVEFTNGEGKSYSPINEAERTSYQLTFNKEQLR